MESLSKMENSGEVSLCGENKILEAVLLLALTGDPSRGAQQSCLEFRQRLESSQRTNQKKVVLQKQKEYCQRIRLRTTTGPNWTLTYFMRNLVYLGFSAVLKLSIHCVQIVLKSPLLVMLCLEILSLKFFPILIHVDMCKVFNDHR